MRSAKDLIGKPIYSITDGRLLGSVKDLYVDSEMREVTGLYVGSEGLFSRKARLIPGDSVSVLGVDAVLTADSNVIKEESEYTPSQGWLRRDSIQGRVMQTAGGTKVASVGDLLIDDDSKVVAFSLARVNVEGPVAKSRVVARNAVVDAGGFDGTMTVDLTEAEQPAVGVIGVAEPVVDSEPILQPIEEEEAADLDDEENPSE
jgi:uncharacterized protein YrrD